MMGSEARAGLKHVQRQGGCMVPGTGLEPVTFGCLRHFEVYRAHSFLCRCPMSPTRHQLRHPGNERFDLTTEYEYIHSSRPFV